MGKKELRRILLDKLWEDSVTKLPFKLEKKLPEYMYTRRVFYFSIEQFIISLNELIRSAYRSEFSLTEQELIDIHKSLNNQINEFWINEAKLWINEEKK